MRWNPIMYDLVYLSIRCDVVAFGHELLALNHHDFQSRIALFPVHRRVVESDQIDKEAERK